MYQNVSRETFCFLCSTNGYKPGKEAGKTMHFFRFVRTFVQRKAKMFHVKHFDFYVVGVDFF